MVSGDMMMFPDTVEEYMEQYKVVDRDHAISNGAEFIAVFRMRQWFDHLQAHTNADRIRAMNDEELADFLDRWEMGSIDYSKTFCSWCKGQYNCRDDCLMDWLKKEAEI